MATQPCQITSDSFKDSTDPFEGSRYRCLSRIASGATGDTYVVEHIELKKRFAAKLLRAEHVPDPKVIDRMRLEAQSLGRLRHPNVVSITGFERTPAGVPFIVMELLRGRTLEAELRARGALSVEEAMHWTKQLLSALDAIHELGVVHRDVCPHNLMLHAPKTGQRVLKVLDFSAARVLTGASERAPKPLAYPTTEGTVVGTPEFASPEVAFNLDVDARSDLYQVGLVLYAMLTGRTLPELREPASGSRIGLITDSIRPPSALRFGGLDPAVDAIVIKALSRNPEDRFRTATEFRLALARHANGSSEIPALLSRDGDAPARVSRLQRILVFLALSTATATAIIAAGLLLSRW